MVYDYGEHGKCIDCPDNDDNGLGSSVACIYSSVGTHTMLLCFTTRRRRSA